MWLPATDCSVRSATPLIDCEIVLSCFSYPYQILIKLKLFISKLLNINLSCVLGLSISVLSTYCPSISPSPVRPYPVNLLRHPWLGPGFLGLCFRPLPRLLPAYTPPTWAPRRTLENSPWLYCSPAEQPDCTCYLSNKSFLCYQMLRMQCTAANLFGIKIYLLSLISQVIYWACLAMLK